MIRQLPAVAVRLMLVYLLILTVTCVDVVSAQVTVDDIKDKKVPVSEVEYIAKDAESDKSPDAQKSDDSTEASKADIPKQLTIDGGWKMPGGIMNISGGVGSVGGTIAEFARNSFGIKPGSAMINGTFDGKQFSGTIVLRSKDEDGNVHEMATPLNMSLSADANTLSGQYENRRFNKTKKSWDKKTRMQSLSFTRVDPIDAQTLAAIKEAMAKANGEGDDADDDPSMAEDEDDSQNEDGSENGPITITSIIAVEELGYRNFQVNNRSGKDKDNIGHIWLRITGENLPVKAESLNITIDDTNINFTGNHKPDPDDEKALQIQVNLAQAAAPGPKQITLNEAPGTWDYDFTDLAPKSIDFVRPVYVDVYNPASELYRGELFFVRVKFPMPVKFKSRKMELKAGQTKLMDLEITPFEGNQSIFHSKALILPGDKAALAIFEDRKGTGIDTPKDAIKLQSINEGQKLVAIFPGSKKDASGQAQIKPYAIATVRGLPSNDWIEAVSKAENCWENSSSSARSKMPKGYTFTNQIIFTTKRNAGEWFTNSRNLHMTIRDHAACLLIRDEGIKQLRAKIQQYNKGDGIEPPTVRNDATKQAHRAAIKKRNDAKRRFAAQMSTAADQNLNHPLMRLQVSGPKNAGNMQLQQAIKSSTLRNAYGDARSMDALNYAVIAIDQAQGVMLGNMNYSLNRLTSLSDCDYEGLLRVCGFGFGSIGQLVKNKLLVPSNEPGVEAGRMVPDRAGYASVDRINTLYKALRADEAYARSDTEMAIFVATAPFIYVSVAAAAGTTAASVAAGGLVAGELAELGLMASDMYDYVQLRDEEIQFREGLVEVAGSQGLSEVEGEANAKYWSAMIAGGAALGGTALGEIGGVLAKKYGESVFEVLQMSVTEAAKKGTKNLSKSSKQLLEQVGLLKKLGDQPTPEMAEALVKNLAGAEQAYKQSAQEALNPQLASSAANPGVRNTADEVVDSIPASSPPKVNQPVPVKPQQVADASDGLSDYLDSPMPPSRPNAPDVNAPKSPDANVSNTPKSEMDDFLDSPMPPSKPQTPDSNAPKLASPDVDAANPPKTPEYAPIPEGPMAPLPDHPKPPTSLDDDLITGYTPPPSKPKAPAPQTPQPNAPKPGSALDDNLGTGYTPPPSKPKAPAPQTPQPNAPKPGSALDDNLGTGYTPPPSKPKTPAPQTPQPNAPKPGSALDDNLGTGYTPPPSKPKTPAPQTPQPNAPTPGSALDDNLGTGYTPPPSKSKTPAPQAPQPNVPAQPVRALDMDIDDVIGYPKLPEMPGENSTFITRTGEQVTVGKRLGQGTFSDVYEIAGQPDRVIKFVKQGEGGERGLNAWQLALEGKQVSEMLEQSGIPQVKVLEAGFDTPQPYMIVEKIDSSKQLIDPDDFKSSARQDMVNAGLWSDEHDKAVVELYGNMAKKNLIWEDGHVGNVFFERNADGKLVAGILDHGRIGKWGEINDSLQSWIDGLEESGMFGEATGGFIFSNKAYDETVHRFASPEEFMVKMLEHKRWIEWDHAAKQFKPLRMDPANIDRNILDLEKYLAPSLPGSTAPGSPGSLTPSVTPGSPGSALPQPFMNRWPWREVLKPAA